jgi:hypothetical protein
MDVDAVAQVEAPEIQRHVLELIEKSATGADDLGLANRARYELRKLAGRESGVRLLDWAFYQGVAGYLVRPVHPLVTLVCLALVLSLARMLRGRWRPLLRIKWTLGRAGWGPRTFSIPHGLTTHLWSTLSSVKNGPAAIAPEQPPRLAHRLEVLGYRALFACFLIALASSNRTLRQLVDAVF